MLKKNNIIDIVSPGTACTRAELEKIKNYVKKLGLVPRIFLEEETSVKKATGHEFASVVAATRFAQLKKSIESNANIIWCTRGGYGSADLLPFLQKMRKPKKPKIFIGFSDITSLNIFLIQNWGWQVISAPMLIQLALAMVSKKSEQAILDLVFSQKPSIPLTTSYHLPLTPITGGCLSVLCSHFGTKNQIDWQGKVLFLEDEGEDGERLDRYFTQIATIIRETKKTPKAILLGNFLEANPHGTPKAKNIEIALKRFAEKLPKKILILSEKSFGHGKDMMPLVLR